MPLQKVKGSVTDVDLREIKRLAQKKSVRKLSKRVLKDLDRDTLSRIISAYLVLKANGHTDSDFVKYLTTKEMKKTLKLGFGAARAVLPALLTDVEFRSLVKDTRKQMNRQKERSEEEQRERQRALQNEPKHIKKIGPVTVKVEPSVPVDTQSQVPPL